MSKLTTKHLVLLNKIVEELNKEENVDYLKETINFFNPVLYIKQKYKPAVGSYQKVKINEIGLWTVEAELKMDYLIKEIPPDIKFSLDLFSTKMGEPSSNKCFNEDLKALHVNKSEIVQANVSEEIVNGFYHSHQRLRANSRMDIRRICIW